ncbi:hypothetical protein ADUPG1_001539, partial [Aduncisulcus paluster]
MSDHFLICSLHDTIRLWMVRKYPVWFPRSDLITLGIPNLPNIADITASAASSAVARSVGTISVHLVKQSTITTKYLFPLMLGMIGPTVSTATVSN